MMILLSVLGISALIVLHELGHMLMARAFGMRVLRFSVGFGPTLLSHQHGDTLWQLAAIPMGGFVQVQGMGPDEPNTPPDDAASYRNKPLWQRFLVIFAGPASNWLVCAALLAALGMSTGLGHYDSAHAVLGELEASGPAASAGLQPGDQVLRVGDAAVSDWASLVSVVRAHPQTPVDFQVRRNDTTLHLQVTPKAGKSGAGIIEAAPARSVQKYGPIAALSAGAGAAWDLTTEQARLLGGMFTGRQSGQLSGLPGIVKTIAKQTEQGFSRMFESLAWLSIGLCLLNLLPVPALDGSRLAFLLLEAVRRRPLDERIEGVVHTAGFALLLGLMLFVSVRDLL